MESGNIVLPVQLPNGVTVQVQAAALGGEQEIAAHAFAMDTVAAAIEGVSTLLVRTLERVEPQKATIEFEVDFSVESGQLTALFVKGTGRGALRIALEWDMSRKTTNSQPGPGSLP